jgi:hypothetical protein
MFSTDNGAGETVRLRSHTADRKIGTLTIDHANGLMTDAGGSVRGSGGAIF